MEPQGTLTIWLHLEIPGVCGVRPARRTLARVWGVTRKEAEDLAAEFTILNEGKFSPSSLHREWQRWAEPV